MKKHIKTIEYTLPGRDSFKCVLPDTVENRKILEEFKRSFDEILRNSQDRASALNKVIRMHEREVIYLKSLIEGWLRKDSPIQYETIFSNE